MSPAMRKGATGWFLAADSGLRAAAAGNQSARA
jgi:hypothetical protein